MHFSIYAMAVPKAISYQKNKQINRAMKTIYLGLLKKITAAIAIAALIGIYYAGNAAAQNVGIGTAKDGNKIIVTPNGSNTGYIMGGGGVTFPSNGPIGITTDGNTVIRQTPKAPYMPEPDQYKNIDEAIAKDPTNAKLYIAKAEKRFEENKTDEAIKIYEYAINQKELKATKEELRLMNDSLAKFYYTKNDLLKASIYYKNVVDINPDNNDAKFMLEYCIKNR